MTKASKVLLAASLIGLAAHGVYSLTNRKKSNSCNTVPLVWKHKGETITVGTAGMENRDDGVYVYGLFNDDEEARAIKSCLERNDVAALSFMYD